MNLLLVDDAPDQTLLLSIFLKKRGYQIFKANHGLDALRVIDENPSINIIISDWMMPYMNGPELCQKLRSDYKNRFFYIILLTGHSGKDASIAGIESGADEFISKPVNLIELEARLNSGKRIIMLQQCLENQNNTLQKTLEIMQSDLQNASDTLYSLLPKKINSDEITIEWLFKPSQFLGGDMFNYFQINEDFACFYQLDVVGHGISSALFSFTLHHVLSYDGLITKQVGKKNKFNDVNFPLKPAEVLGYLNERFQSPAEQLNYFTIILGVINLKTGEVRIAQAGHPNILVISPSRAQINTISGSGVPIGMMPKQSYEEKKFFINSGDSLVLYSDGIIEHENPVSKQFGKENLINCFSMGLDPSNQLSSIIDNLYEKLLSWGNNNVFADDISCLLIKWK